MPLSEIQCVCTPLVCATSTHVSDATRLSTPTVPRALCAWRSGTAPYNAIGLSATYSKMSTFQSRYGSE